MFLQKTLGFPFLFFLLIFCARARAGVCVCVCVSKSVSKIHGQQIMHYENVYEVS